MTLLIITINKIKSVKKSLAILQFVITIWFNTEDKNNLTTKDFPLKFLKKL